MADRNFPNRRPGFAPGSRGGPAADGGGDRRDRDADRSSFQPTSPELLKKIITDPTAAQEMVKEADRIGKELARELRPPLATSQIRSLFGEVRNIEGDWKINPARASRRLVLLQPKMAYRARKEPGQGVRYLVEVLSPAIDLVAGQQEHFQRFVEFFEAILAYHKAYGGN